MFRNVSKCRTAGHWIGNGWGFNNVRHNSMCGFISKNNFLCIVSLKNLVSISCR